MSSQATVHVDSVSKRYRDVRALDEVSLTFGTGITGLLGPNGAGKTTLLSSLATVLPPDDGHIRVLGHDAYGSASDRTAIRRTLGFLPQEVGFPRAMTVFGFVEYIAVLKEWTEPATRRAEVVRVLDRVGLGDRGTKKVRALSGGQRRRLALAQALLGDPRLVILDEPTTGVDPEQRAVLRQLLSQTGEQAAVLLATHQTEDVAALCDRVVVLDGGRIRFDGAVRDLVDSARGRVWLADSEDRAARVSWRTGTGRYRCVGEAPPDDAELTEPALEDAYLLLVGSRATVGAEVAA
jgi:ABC-2 type transport system ATP-binding protein